MGIVTVVKRTRLYYVVVYGYLAGMAVVAAVTRQPAIVALGLVGFVGIYVGLLVSVGWSEMEAAERTAPGDAGPDEEPGEEHATDAPASVETLTVQLDRLERMHRNGIISADEYEAKRARLIARF
jgi:hypothetical protein